MLGRWANVYRCVKRCWTWRLQDAYWQSLIGCSFASAEGIMKVKALFWAMSVLEYSYKRAMNNSFPAEKKDLQPCSQVAVRQNRLTVLINVVHKMIYCSCTCGLSQWKATWKWASLLISISTPPSSSVVMSSGNWQKKKKKNKVAKLVSFTGFWAHPQGPGEGLRYAEGAWCETL